MHPTGITPNLPLSPQPADVERAREFYQDYLGFAVEEMNQGWVMRFSTPDGRASVQLVTRDASAPVDSRVVFISPGPYFFSQSYAPTSRTSRHPSILRCLLGCLHLPNLLIREGINNLRIRSCDLRHPPFRPSNPASSFCEAPVSDVPHRAPRSSLLVSTFFRLVYIYISRVATHCIRSYCEPSVV